MKKYLLTAALLAAVLTVSAGLPAYAEDGESSAEAQENTEVSALTGDVNGDGLVNAADAAVVLRAAAGTVELDTQASYNADVTASMTVDQKDAAALLLFSSGLMPSLDPTSASALDGELLGEKFADRFSYSGTVRTDNSYRSGMVNVTTTKKKVGRSYVFIADIYIRDITAFQTAFGKGEFNKGREMTRKLAKDNGAIIAVNGDSLSYSKAVGTLIRSGELYVEKTAPSDDTLVLYRDGRMLVFGPGTTLETMQAEGEIYHTWCFGPMLLDANGEAMTEFNSSRHITSENPRTAIGYYEPGHYCFVVVDGRQSGYSVGLTLEELSAFMKELGCTAAYNMDGGQTTVMADASGVINQPYGGGRSTTDILYITEPALVEAAKNESEAGS